MNRCFTSSAFKYGWSIQGSSNVGEPWMAPIVIGWVRYIHSLLSTRTSANCSCHLWIWVYRWFTLRHCNLQGSGTSVTECGSRRAKSRILIATQCSRRVRGSMVLSMSLSNTTVGLSSTKYRPVHQTVYISTADCVDLVQDFVESLQRCFKP